jgi:serine/threonine protein kinase/WD40 repeat protein/tetratricopeptide (TPR) repeat protein
MSFTGPGTADRDPVELLAEEFVERQRRGERPSLTEYLNKYPELAESIRDLFPALAMIELLKSGGDDVFGDIKNQSARRMARFGEIIGQLGDYRLLREVGRGGMGLVYEAVQESLGRHVALKILPQSGRLGPTEIERFQLEARSAARLHHGNIVPVYGVGEHQGMHYYAMQFIQGHGLDAILDDLRKLRGVALSPAARSGEARVPEKSSEPGSMAMACSLIMGRFDDAGASVAGPSTALLAADGAQTMAEPNSVDAPPFRSTSFSATSPVREPPQSSTSALSESSSLTMADESQFYRSAARIALQVAEALDYAHHQGVLHRDIKPSNLLLDATGNIWVTDFGLAKIEGSDGPTRTGDVVGTTRYMAPERFAGWSDRRSDIYSLGATLYELLTLQPLFSEASQAGLVQKVLHDAPLVPRKIDPRIPRDLETIVLTAIAKEPAQRYTTAGAIGEDLKRFLGDWPILARRSTLAEQLWRWCRRNQMLAGTSIAAAAAILVLAIGAIVAAWIFRAQRDQIRQAETQGRVTLFEALLEQGRARRYSRQVGQRFQSLEALRRAARIGHELDISAARFDRLRDEVIACLALPDLDPTGLVIDRPPGAMFFAFDPAMTRLALRLRDEVQIRRVGDNHEIARFQAPGSHEVYLLCFSPDGRYLATQHHPGLTLTVWDLERRTVVMEDPHSARGRSADFSPDSRQVAVGRSDGTILVYDLASGRPGRSCIAPAPQDLSFRPDGTQIAATCRVENRGSCRIMDVESGRLVRSIPLPAVGGVAWSSDGSTLATACSDLRVYLWDAATGTRRAILTGHTNAGLISAFHSSGALLASNGWEDRLWLWDPVLTRPWLSLINEGWPQFTEFSRDGRIVVAQEGQLVAYRADPALAYRTFAHASALSPDYEDVSVHRSGRLLAVGTSQGVALWDLARGRELAFLPIGNARHVLFEPSGDLLTSGTLGVRRWRIVLGPAAGKVRVGPPSHLALPASLEGISEDRSGSIVALCNGNAAHVLTPERALQIGPLDDSRSVSVSPDGQFLATGRFGGGSVRVWRIADAAEVARLEIEGRVGVEFSPDGKWLLTAGRPCRLWTVGSWREAHTVGGQGLCFAVGGRQLYVQDVNKVIRLVDTETGRTLARFESPDLCTVHRATSSPDGSQLVFSTNDGPAVHVWDLRDIRARLTEWHLDWDAPPFLSASGSRAGADTFAPLEVDVEFGPLTRYSEYYKNHIEQHTLPAEELVARHNERLRAIPDDLESLHQRAHALRGLDRFEAALADFSAASTLRPLDAHLRAYQGVCLIDLRRNASAAAQLEQAIRMDPESLRTIIGLDRILNNRAWELAAGESLVRDPELAVRLASLSVAMAPFEQTSLNTLGVALYRADRLAEAIEALAKSLDAGAGQFDGFDLFFLAMAHHRLGHETEARDCFDRAARWMGEQRNLPEQYARELAAFRSEAECVLRAPADELPADVFTGR